MQVAVRLPKALVREIDRAVENGNKLNAVKLSRSTVIRYALSALMRDNKTYVITWRLPDRFKNALRMYDVLAAVVEHTLAQSGVQGSAQGMSDVSLSWQRVAQVAFKSLKGFKHGASMFTLMCHIMGHEVRYDNRRIIAGKTPTKGMTKHEWDGFRFVFSEPVTADMLLMWRRDVILAIEAGKFYDMWHGSIQTGDSREVSFAQTQEKETGRTDSEVSDVLDKLYGAQDASDPVVEAGGLHVDIEWEGEDGEGV